MPTVLITGANRGLGFEFARQYAADGWDVIATCRAPEKAVELKALAAGNPSVRIEPLNVADDSSISQLAGKIKDEAVDVLINNAGILSGNNPAYSASDDSDDMTQAFGTIDPRSWEKVLRINAIAPVMVTQALLPNLRCANGKVIMVSSIMGSIEKAYTGYIAYCTSKAALNMAMRDVAQSLLNEKIIVVSLHPDWVKTDMGGKNARLTPEESVKGMRNVIDKLSLDQSGQFLRCDGEILPW